MSDESTALSLDEYQKQSRSTARYPRAGSNPYYPALGLVGEAGEVANQIKKVMRDDKDVVTDERRAVIRKELGDVLWYVAQVASELNLSLTDVAQANLTKLADRKARGVLSGSSDNR